MNTAVAAKSRVKVVNKQPENASPAPRASRKKATPWGAVAFFVALVAALTLLFSPNEPKIGKDVVQTEKSVNGFGNTVLSR